jgi:hypothetical protein
MWVRSLGGAVSDRAEHAGLHKLTRLSPLRRRSIRQRGPAASQVTLPKPMCPLPIGSSATSLVSAMSTCSRSTATTGVASFRSLAIGAPLIRSSIPPMSDSRISGRSRLDHRGRRRRRGWSKASWVRNMFDVASTHRHSRLRALVWFDVDNERDWRATSSAAERRRSLHRMASRSR